MKNYILKYSAAFAACVLAVSCIEETFPEGSTVTGDQLSQSDAALQSLVNSIPVAMNQTGYTTSSTDYHFDFGKPGMGLIFDMSLEDVIFPSNPGYNWFTYYATMNKVGPDNFIPSYFWTGYYKWIKNANDVIRAIDEESANEDQLVYLGQAYAFRASYYLDLARMYEFKENKYTIASDEVKGLTVPIMTENTTEEMSRNNPRASHDEMYAFILSDLEKASELLRNAGRNWQLPTISAVNGLFARTYIEMGAAGDGKEYYEKAAEYAQKVISGGYSPLTKAQWHDPLTGFNSGDSNNAWVWGLTLSASNCNNIVTFISHICNEATWGYTTYTHPSAHKKFYEAIPETDWRKYSWIDPMKQDFYNYQLNGTAAQQARFWSTKPDYASLKFRPAQGETTEFTVGNCADYPLMRVEEMYFLLAESYANLGRMDEAASALNTLMKTRNPKYDCSSSTRTLETFLDELLFQKRVEFWGEGILMFDYKRLNRGVDRTYAGSNCPASLAMKVDGRSPGWNIVITRTELQNNLGIPESLNNPDPSEKIPTAGK